MKMLEMKNVNFRPWPKFRNWEKQSFGHGRRIEFSVNLHFGHGRNAQIEKKLIFGRGRRVKIT